MNVLPLAGAERIALFVFGTLRDSDVRQIVLGRELPAQCCRKAELVDYIRLMMHDETYPVLAAHTGGRVPGDILSLTPQDLERVMFFEAEEYQLEAAQVLDSDGHAADVVFCAERATRSGPRYPWSLRQWQAEHKHVFLEHARAYMALYGKMSARQADVVWRELVGR